jgi:hypothetical protein
MADGNKSRNPLQIKIPIWRERRCQAISCPAPLCPAAPCGMLLFIQMRGSLQPPIAPGRVFAGWVCLLAALLLWTPMWATAWQANAMACCNGKQCAAHGHSPDSDKTSRPTKATDDEPAMQCHPSGTSLMPCSMACCQSPEHVFAASILFVLPAPATLAAPMQSLPAASGLETPKILTAFAPPSPPPKRTLLSL